MSPQLQKLNLLKNIFLSTNEKELFESFSKLNTSIIISSERLEADFNRYFIGPDAPLAAPYASIYIDETKSVMTESTQKVRQIYDLIGLINPLKHSQPDDFIGLELDAYYQLLFLEEEKEIEFLEEIRLYFLHEHLSQWIFKFCDSVISNTEYTSESIQYLAQELKIFFEKEIQHEGALL